jgi:outer membrane protein TolC
MALDRVAREIIEAHTRVESRRKQIAVAEQAVKAAEDSYRRNLLRAENAQGLPIEALQSISALGLARRDYLRAVSDHNLAQFQLVRAIGGGSPEFLAGR